MFISMTWIYVAIGVLVVILILTNIPWRRLAEYWVKDNPSRCVVYYDTGKNTEKCYGNRVTVGENGSTYHYKRRGQKLTLLVPKSYPHKYCNGLRMLMVRDGDLKADGFKYEQYLDLDRDTAGELMWGHLLHGLLRDIQGKTQQSWIWIVVAVLAGAAVFYVAQNYIVPNFVDGGGPAQTANVTENRPVDSTEPLR